MREQEVRDLYEAYQQVHQVQEEVEQLDEAEVENDPYTNPKTGKPHTFDSRADALRRKGKAEKIRAKASPAATVKLADEVETDLFDTILEYLVAEGYAETPEAATAIMANMSEEWRQSIVDEAYDPKGQDKLVNKMSSLAKPDPDSTQAQNQKRKDRSNIMYDKHYTSYVRPNSMPGGIGGPKWKSRKNKEKNG